MTARVCPVHGEYAPTGICRWCEPAPAKYSRAACDDVPTYMGVPVVIDPYASSDAAPVLVSWTLIEKTDEAYGWRVEWTAPVPPGPELNADKERRLAEEHAALRWERVARRWNYKHRGASGLDEAGRRYVWLHWVDQMNRRFP